MANGTDRRTHLSVTLETKATPVNWTGWCEHEIAIENQRFGSLHHVESHSYDPTHQVLFNNAQDFVVVHGLVRSRGTHRAKSTVTTASAVGQTVEVYTASDFFDATQKIIAGNGRSISFTGPKEVINNKYYTITG